MHKYMVATELFNRISILFMIIIVFLCILSCSIFWLATQIGSNTIALQAYSEVAQTQADAFKASEAALKSFEDAALTVLREGTSSKKEKQNDEIRHEG